jgi:nucleoside-diphosphate-sugar epimerase
MDISRSKALLDWRHTFSLTEAFTDYVAELQRAW